MKLTDKERKIAEAAFLLGFAQTNEGWNGEFANEGLAGSVEDISRYPDTRKWVEGDPEFVANKAAAIELIESTLS